MQTERAKLLAHMESKKYPPLIFEKITVTAKPRALKTNYILELAPEELQYIFEDDDLNT